MPFETVADLLGGHAVVGIHVVTLEACCQVLLDNSR
jgi:hypothetical protein